MEDVNLRQREEFIDFWVEYIKTHSDEDWSRQQNVLINSALAINQASRDRLDSRRRFIFFLHPRV